MISNEIKLKIQELSKSMPIVTLNEKESGKKFKFYTPNPMSLWRAETLYTKEPVTINWIKKFEKEKVFFDIGANVGMYSIFASIYSEVEVHSFEPESNNFQILNENIHLNDL